MYGGALRRQSVRNLLGQDAAIEWIDTATFRTGPSAGQSRTEAVQPILTHSPISYSVDGMQALVRIGISCGPLCGGADFVVLQRLEANRWQVSKTWQYLRL